MALRRYALMSDTHGKVHPRFHEILTGVEAVLHAGDVGGEEVLVELRIHASVHAVAGNVDMSSADLPPWRVVEMPFGKVGIAHGHRQSAEQWERSHQLREMFAPKGVRLILHGHSHLAFLDYRSGVYVVNPGPAGRPRFGDPSGFCLLEWDSERDLLRFDFQPLDWS